MRKPKSGERYAKLITDKNGVTYVRSRTVRRVGQPGVFYELRRVVRFATFAEWRAWVKTARKCAPR
jgi:hypothetical protein